MTQGVIVVRAQLVGPSGERTLFMAVDTGSIFTVVPPSVLRAVGYADLNPIRRERIVTASDLIEVPVVATQAFSAIGRQRQQQEVVAHALPESAQFHGLLGLDFLRGTRLTIDFRRGEIELEP